MHFRRTGVEEHLHDLSRRVPTDDGVVHSHDALSRHLRERVELQLDPLFAQSLVGLDERPPDIAVLDQAFAEGDVERAGEADRGRRPRVGNGKDEVGLDGRLLCEPLAHADTRGVHLDAREARIRSSEVEELEDAERAAAVRWNGLPRLDAFADHEQLARPHLAFELGADQVERAGLGGDDPVAVEASEAEWAHPAGIAEGDQLSLAERDDRERPVELAHRGGNGVAERAGFVSDQRCDHLGVRGRREPVTLGVELLAELGGVREVAVMAQGDRACAAVLDERLRVPPLRRAGRRVTRVADGEVAAQAAELLLVEDLRHEPHVAQRRQPPVVGDGDARGLLAAVLQREQPEVGEPRDVAAGRTHTEEAAHQPAVPMRCRLLLPRRRGVATEITLFVH